MRPLKYADWFGSGSTRADAKRVIAEHGQPEAIFTEKDGHMAALVYPNKIIVTGYDGNEHRHTFVCDYREELP